jgi:hypothetical protein
MGSRILRCLSWFLWMRPEKGRDGGFLSIYMSRRAKGNRDKKMGMLVHHNLWPRTYVVVLVE